MATAPKYKIKFTAAARNQILLQIRNDTQILKAAVLKFKANRQSKPKNQNVKFKPSRPSRKQSRGLKVKFAKNRAK
nr:hypothetical protein [uncultured Campylobacter sp.]